MPEWAYSPAVPLGVALDHAPAEARYAVVVGTRTFTDDSLGTRLPIKARHVTELRSAIIALHNRYGLLNFEWSQAAPAKGGVVLKDRLTDRRTALNQAYAATVKTHSACTDPTITAGQTVIETTHLT